MSFRRRMNRKADSGLPGYDNLGRLNMGHPATKELPSIDQYGFDDEFGEGIRKGPYLSGPPPASVGWMPDHPATKKSLVEDYEIGHELHDANIKKAMERKANKCIAIAEHRLGRTASAREIESLALRLMDLPNNSINSKFASATDFMAEDQFGMDEMGFDEMGFDEMGTDQFAGHSHASFMAETEQASDELSELMAELEAGEEPTATKQASFRRNRRASLRNRRYANQMMGMDTESDAELAELMADLEAGDELQNATGYHGSDIGPGNRNADFDGGIVGYDDFDGGMMMENDFSDAMSPVDVLAEEIANLKQANAKLKHRLRKAEEAVQDATGYHGEEDSVQPAGRYKEPGEGAPTARYASKNGLKRLANVLADYLAEEEGTTAHGHMSSFMAQQEEADSENVMAEILAELEGGYDPEISQNDNQFGYSENLMGGDDGEESVAEMLASMLAEEQKASKLAKAKASAKKESEKASAKKESEDPMGLDENGDDEGMDPKLASLFAKFAEDDSEGEVDDEAEEEKKASKSKSAAKKTSDKSKSSAKESAKLADQEEADEDEETTKKSSKNSEKKSNSNKKAFEWKFSAEEEADEEEADDEEADDEEADEEETSKKASWRFAEEEEAEEEEADEEETTSSKKASFSPRPSINSRKASVKTLGNISRTASKSDSNELSKLWESAPDVSKYFS